MRSRTTIWRPGRIQRSSGVSGTKSARRCRSIVERSFLVRRRWFGQTPGSFWRSRWGPNTRCVCPGVCQCRSQPVFERSRIGLGEAARTLLSNADQTGSSAPSRPTRSAGVRRRFVIVPGTLANLVVNEILRARMPHAKALVAPSRSSWELDREMLMQVVASSLSGRDVRGAV